MDRRSGLLLGIGVIAVVAAIGLIPAGPRAILPERSPSASPVRLASYPPPMALADIYAAFGEDRRATTGGQPTTVTTVSAGDLVLPTGRVVGADAFFFSMDPFTRTLPAGRHPVLLLSSVRDIDSSAEAAAAMVRVAPGDPISWELALVPGQNASTLTPGEIFGYPVDSGTGSFASPEAAAVVSSGDFDGYSDRIQQGMFPSDNTADWRVSVDLIVDPTSGANVIGFTSGAGDGTYPSWFGLDAGGEPLVLLTDFGLLDALAP